MPLRRVSTLTPAVLALLFLCATFAAAQRTQAVVRGQVTDSSGAVLPGVTVVAAATDGRVLTTAETDGAGGYVLDGLPAGPVVLTFQLDGFTSVNVALKVRPGAESQVVERLELAPYSETVLVRAPAIFEPLPPFVPTPSLLPTVKPVPPHDRDSICGPAKPGLYPESLGTIKASRTESKTGLYTNGAELVIDGGLRDGLDIGRNLVVRRYYHVLGERSDVVGEHSAGLVQIVAAEMHSAIAVVVYACDEIRSGDFLAPFNPEPIRPPDPPGIPAYRNAARILFADEGQTLAAPRRLMVIDQGTARGTRVGERVTLFRLGRSERRDVIGDAIVVAVRSDSATIRVDRVTDAISAGDWAAPQTGSSATSRQP
jgi:hypothetical protein